MSAILQADSRLCNDFQIANGQNHYARLHDQPYGITLIWQAGESKGRWQKLTPNHASVPGLLAEQLNQPDRYISVNEFHAWRIVSHLKSLRACFCDIDGCTNVDLCLQAVAAAGLPSPSFIILSGRGVHLYWLIEAVPAKALAVWQQVQDTLLKKLKEQNLPVDMKARDCTRVLRLAGSINSKNGAKVSGYLVNDWRWDLHTLADEVLGNRADKAEETKRKKALAADQQRDAQISDFRAAQLRKGVTPKTSPKGAQKGGIYAWWQLVYQDLITIGDQLGGIKKGHRDTYLFLYAVALSWFTGAESLENEVMLVAKKVMPEFKAAEINKAVQPNLKRIKDALDGKTVVWQGQERDPRYWYKRETMVNLLSDLITPDMYGQLRALLPADVIAARKAEREKSRERYADSNTKAGVRASNLHKAALARELRAAGKTYQEIAKMLEASFNSIYRWCNSSN